MVEKASRLPSVYLSFFTQFREKLFVCKQQRRRSASAPAQFYQLSLESMIAIPAICKKNKNSCQTCVRGSRQFQQRGGGRIASRGRFVPVFILGNKWQLMIFMGRSGPPAPSVSTHIRVSNSLNSHFIFIFCWAWSIHKTSANYIS